MCAILRLLNLLITFQMNNFDTNSKRTFTLFEGRHELPTNEGALFSSFDFETKRGIKTPLFDEFVNSHTPKLIVTGLTPALIEVLSVLKEQEKWCTLLHFDSATGSYWEQDV